MESNSWGVGAPPRWLSVYSRKFEIRRMVQPQLNVQQCKMHSLAAFLLKTIRLAAKYDVKIKQRRCELTQPFMPLLIARKWIYFVLRFCGMSVFSCLLPLLISDVSFDDNISNARIKYLYDFFVAPYNSLSRFSPSNIVYNFPQFQTYVSWKFY